MIKSLLRLCVAPTTMARATVTHCGITDQVGVLGQPRYVPYFHLWDRFGCILFVLIGQVAIFLHLVLEIEDFKLLIVEGDHFDYLVETLHHLKANHFTDTFFVFKFFEVLFINY